MADELVIGYNPMPATQRVAHFRAMIRSRLIWFALAVVICVAIYVWQRQHLDGLSTVALFVMGLGFSAVWVVIAVVGHLAAKRSLDSIGEGTAVTVDRDGIELAGARTPWTQVAKVATARGRLGMGPDLLVTDAAGTSRTVPLSYLDTLPGTLDSAIRAYSSGRHWLDTSGLDN